MYTDFHIQEIFPMRVANPLFIGFASLEGNISCIWKSMWINQYITLFFTEHFKFVSICFDVFKRSVLEHRYNYAKGYFYDRHFVSKWTRLSLTDLWIGSEKGILHFTFTVIVCPATSPGDLKFITDSLPLFGLNQTYLIVKSKASMMWGNAMPHEWTNS